MDQMYIRLTFALLEMYCKKAVMGLMKISIYSKQNTDLNFI